MKRIFTFLLIVFAYLTASAESVSEQQALQKAQQFMKGKQLATSPGKARVTSRLSKDTVAHGYYVFNTVESNGFVIIASDDRMPEVLGYSEHGCLDPATAPCNVKWLLEYYDKAAANIKQVGAKARAVRKASKPDVRPLITTTWDQGAPYNLMCPEYNGSQCITGCVATAMAQVINYNRWPVGETTGVPAYTTASAQISVPALEPTRFNWDNMTNDDVARLMRYCGQSVQMDYGVNESGALPVNEAPALTKVFGYSQTAHYAEHANYSENEWEDLLYNELAEQRPIVFNGFGNTGGHTFVVHGYRDGRFYINWGWSGNEDGYFYLTSLNTSAGDYSSDQSATIGIQPPAGADVSRPKVVVKDIGYSGEKYFFRNEANEFPFYVYGRLVSDLAEQKSLSVGLGLYDAEGLKKVLWEEKHDFPVGEEYNFDASLTISSDISDGEYRIVPISRDNEKDTWRTDANSSDYYLTVTIKGNSIKVLSYPLSSEERSITDLGVQTIDGITYNLYIQNGKNRASVLPCETGLYQGDLVVPDIVAYQGTDYKVYTTSFGAFQDCMNLTSLSIAASYVTSIYNCEKLKKIELREGVMSINSIGGCHQLESIEFPKSLAVVQDGISRSQKLKTIRFKNTSQVTFGRFPEWDSNSLPSLTDVYFVSPYPPMIQWKDGELKTNSKTVIHVPQGSKADFEASDWKGWNIVEDLPVQNNNGIEWGYCEGNTVYNNGPYDTVGANDGEYAIHVPASMLEAYKGKTISSIQVYLAMVYDYVFITKPGTDYLVKQPLEGVSNSWVSVDLPEPYTITGDELFIGVGHKGNIGMFFSDVNVVEKDGLWLRAMGTDDSQLEPGEWICIPEEEASYAHPIPLRFVISGNDMPEDAVLKDVVLKPNSKNNYSFTAKVINRSVGQLKKVTIEWDFDGTNKGSKALDIDIRPARSQTISFNIDATLEGRNHDFNYTITKVNNTADGVKANSTGTINFNTAANTYYPRRIVMEEATGTWCGWCVRGIETIDRLTKQYPDNFIAIGLHNRDEMADFDNYGVIAKTFNSYPSCIINRKEIMNPALPLIKPLVDEMKDKAEAKVSATAVYAKRDYSAVTVNTETLFGFSDSKTANFRLSYALVEDHVGPYVQNNFYSGTSVTADDEYMEEWTKKDAKVKIEFNDVARGLYGGAEGVDGSLPTAIKEGEAYKYSYSFALPDNVANRNNLRIVVMLVDNNTGEIVNACQTKIEYDKSVESQIFTLKNNGKDLIGVNSVKYVPHIDSWGNIGECGTNVEEGKDGLVLETYEAKVTEGTAKLEILSNAINPQQLTWTMGGSAESVIGKTSIEKSFKTQANGKLPIGLTAKDMKSYGTLEARLTMTIGSQTESVTIIFENEEPVVGNVVLKENQTWWNNHDTHNAYTGATGSESDEHYDVAIYIPFNMLAGKGTTIDGFCFKGTNATYGKMTNAIVWVSTTLPEVGEKADMEIIHIPNNQIRNWTIDAANEVTFKNKHEIPESGLYVGYSFDIEGDVCPLEFTNSDKNRKGGFWVRTDSSPKWTDLSKRFGNLRAKVMFEGEFPHNAAQTSDFVPVSVLKGGKAKTQVELTNTGANVINTVTLSVKGSNGSEETVVAPANIPAYEIGNLSFELKADDAEGSDYKTITITKVNGQNNTSSDGTSAKGLLITLDKSAKVKPVIEGYAATWDYSRIATSVAYNKLHEIFGNQIIQIMPHMNDQFTLPEYEDILSFINWDTYINRVKDTDSYMGDTNEAFGIEKTIRESISSMVSPASVTLKAEWTDDQKESIDIITEIPFKVDIKDNPFLVGYVLTEDGIIGNQKNAYAELLEPNGDPILEELASLPSNIPDFKHNFVPVAAWGAYKGLEGTLPSDIVAGQKNEYTYRADISGNFYIHNKENLCVIALLVDKKSGAIVNAAKYYLGEGSNNEDPDPTPQDEAKVFEFRYEGKALDNNSTVEIPAALDSYGFGELECVTNPSSNPMNGLVLATKDGKKLSGTATITISKNTLNPNMVQWCMGGECVPMNDKSSLTKNFTTDDEGICQVMFDATNIKSEGVLEARLSATVSNETRVVNIKFIYSKTTGLNIIYSGDDGAVWYDMNGNRLENAPTRKGVYIRNGKKVVR